MAEEFTVKVTRETFRQHSDGVITGTIYIEMGEVAFPARDWGDFVVVVLTWWLNALRSVPFHAGKETKFLFMDGPFAIRGLKRQGQVYLEAIDSRRGEKVKGSAAAEIAAFEREIVSAARSILGIAERKSWHTREVDELRAAIRD